MKQGPTQIVVIMEGSLAFDYQSQEVLNAATNCYFENR